MHATYSRQAIAHIKGKFLVKSQTAWLDCLLLNSRRLFLNHRVSRPETRLKQHNEKSRNPKNLRLL